jgi:hypothetical protein
VTVPVLAARVMSTIFSLETSFHNHLSTITVPHPGLLRRLWGYLRLYLHAHVGAVLMETLCIARVGRDN